MKEGRDLWWHDLMKDASPECKPEVMDAEDPLFILYTSGSTGKPKGMLHTTAGYMVYTGTTFKYIFDYKPKDIYWCTADIGWITGHSYIVYGPLSQGATTVMFEGVPTYPDAGRFWDVVERHGINQLYTAPTAIRALMGKGDEFPAKYDLSSLRVLGTVGEPINPAAWTWYHEHIGHGKTPIVDTYWQTETGGFLLTPFPGATPTKPGSATLPFFGVEPAIIDAEGNEIEGPGEGRLVIKAAWPGMARTIYGDHARYEQTYYSDVPGRYFTSDGAKRDEDGYYWITGRVDDVINVSGHRMGTAEVESALVAHETVSEAAVVGYPHAIKGQGIYAYVTLTKGAKPSEELRAALIKHVRGEIGPIATPDAIQFTTELPKTRSGKIMRRILKRISADQAEEIGDTTTLANPDVVSKLIDGHRDMSRGEG
jgi:acetyl-CoA synthetase